MKDETHAFISDVKARGSTARSARNRRTHNGKGGKVRLPSDNLSKKELMKMSGECKTYRLNEPMTWKEFMSMPDDIKITYVKLLRECKTYRLNEPMTWKEFMSMPDDIKITYVKLLRQKFNAPGKYIAEMLGRNVNDYSKEIKRLGISEGKNCRGRCTPWDREGFYAWANGVGKLPTPVIEEQEHCEPDPVNHEEPEAFLDEDIPWSVPEQVPEVKFLVEPHYPIPQTAVPCNGSMTFKCPANLALNTLKDVLANEMMEISVMWRVIEEGGDGQ